MQCEMDGVKYKIFKKAVALFCENSFDLVTLNDIAASLKMSKSGLYHYYHSKDDFLECMYSFFREHFFDERKPLEKLKPIFETGTILDMLVALTFKFAPEYAEVMIDILTVIHQRKYFDKEARAIAKGLLIDEGYRYVEEAFGYAVSIGRLAPFNTHWIATVLNDTVNGVYMRSLVDDTIDQYVNITTEELAVYQNAAAMIEDLRPAKPSIQNNQ